TKPLTQHPKLDNLLDIFGRNTENNENDLTSESDSDNETTADSDYKPIAGPRLIYPKKICNKK
ncbi:18488_t:CDS:1, partial [Dentiscutata erythropus]